MLSLENVNYSSHQNFFHESIGFVDVEVRVGIPLKNVYQDLS